MVLNITFLGSMDKAQQMREGRKGRNKGKSEEQEGQREEQTNLSPPHW